MRSFRLFAGWLAVLLLLQSCAKSDDVVESPPAMPADEATADERLRIQHTLDEIEGLAAALGRPQQFRSLPILVTTEDQNAAKRAGACFTVNGRGRYIIVNRNVLRQEEVLSAAGVENTLFRVVLHEIGHCYLGRDHMGDQIFQAGRRISWRRKGGEVGFPSLNVSSMEPHTLTMPNVLKKYYVAELLGLERATVLGDLATHASFAYEESGP